MLSKKTWKKMSTAAYIHDLNILNYNFEWYLLNGPFHLQMAVSLNV